MIDVGDKPTTRRRAVARARVKVSDEVLARLADGTMPKGDVLATARVAGIMAAKSTPQILPLCHPLLLTHVAVDLEIDRAGGCVRVTTAAETTHQTGVEMEALCAAAAAALCVHDMCKSLDPAMVDRRHLPGVEVGRQVGRLGAAGVRAAVVTVSDGVFHGQRDDASGAVLETAARDAGFDVGDRRVVPDEVDADRRRRDRAVRCRDRARAGDGRHRLRAARRHPRGAAAAL